MMGRKFSSATRQKGAQKEKKLVFVIVLVYYIAVSTLVENVVAEAEKL